MMLKKIAATVAISAALVATTAGCSSRRIDPAATGSTGVNGTSWQMFCDGPNAVFWVPGLSGDPDELEAYVYDHYKCAPEFYAKNPGVLAPVGPSVPDSDGIIEDEE